MPIALNDSLRLGYGGAGFIDSTQVLITGGSINTANTISYLNAVDIIPTNASRSRMKHADGTRLTSASLSFDMTDIGLTAVDNLFERRAQFDIAINDGNTEVTLDNCFATSITLSGAAGGLISGNINAISIEDVSTTGVANSFYQGSRAFGLLVVWKYRCKRLDFNYESTSKSSLLK